MSSIAKKLHCLSIQREGGVEALPSFIRLSKSQQTQDKFHDDQQGQGDTRFNTSDGFNLSGALDRISKGYPY